MRIWEKLKYETNLLFNVVSIWVVSCLERLIAAFPFNIGRRPRCTTPILFGQHRRPRLYQCKKLLTKICFFLVEFLIQVLLIWHTIGMSWSNGVPLLIGTAISAASGATGRSSSTFSSSSGSDVSHATSLSHSQKELNCEEYSNRKLCFGCPLYCGMMLGYAVF